MERPDIDEFKPGAMYEDSHTGEVVEYLGPAVVNELAGETVAVFRFTGGEGLLVATRRDYNNGQVFVPFGDAVEFDIEADR